MGTIRKLSRLLNPREKSQALILMAALLFGALLEMVGVGAIPAFVAVLTDPDVALAHPVGAAFVRMLGLETTNQIVLAGASILVLFFLLKNLYLVLLAWAKARFVLNRQVAISRRLFGAYLNSPYTFHLQRNTAELLRNTNQDAMQIVGQGLMPLLQLFMECFTVMAILALLLFVEPITSLAAFIVLGGTTALFLRVVRGQIIKVGEDERSYRGGMIQSVNEGLGGIKVTKVLGRERHFLDLYTQNSSGYAVAGRTKLMLQEIPRLILETTAVAGLLGVAALLLFRERSVGSLIPTLTLLAVAVVRMIPSFNRITSALNSLRYGRAAIRGVYRDFALLGRDETRPKVVPALDRGIRLEAVTYTYPGAPVSTLKAITLEIPRGSATGFVGPTGAGKTTLIDVVLGLLVPDDGEVLIDGKSIRGREAAWQRMIGYIPQDIYLADTNIRQNIAFGIPDDRIDPGAVGRAVQAAQIQEFVEDLPDGLETMVGERGVRLSGGQRQRIGIARALYHDPAVLIMDEATSALDNETERYVMQAIESLRGDRTILIIAHRLSTVAKCDQLVLLGDGKVKAVGKYGDLMRQNADLRRMAGAG